ncbi:MAG: helix-turn-helix transcriptional regulator [Ruminococcus sp.]|nr:helix-turn-helix transcriptional regulator [Ruminococcus sp.]
MEVANQIKKYRTANGWSQETLAEKAYVSRQTVSNWENEKSYPDIHSLVLLGNIFNISLDELIKGDVEVMKKQISNNDVKSFTVWSWVLTGMMLAMVLSAVPLFRLGAVGIAIWAAVTVLTLLVCIKVEKLKKRYDIQTYREIYAFMEGKPLDEIAADRKKYTTARKIMFGIASGAVGVLVSVLMMWLLK